VPTPFWRSPDAVEQLNRLDSPGLAGEFLRRNPAYRAGYHQMLRRAAQDGSISEAVRSEFASRWGLSFRS
jgi:Family of unknown function (DUF6499)